MTTARQQQQQIINFNVVVLLALLFTVSGESRQTISKNRCTFSRINNRAAR